MVRICGDAKGMNIKLLSDEDFVNYRLPSMFIAFPSCSFKCEKECGVRCCQNSELAKAPSVFIDERDVCLRYLSNPITKAIVCGGLEPFDSFPSLLSLLALLRTHYECSDPVVIYTGYNKEEISDKIDELKKYSNVIVKFGRYIPGQPPHYDEVLGVTLGLVARLT